MEDISDISQDVTELPVPHYTDVQLLLLPSLEPPQPTP
jgi:hypothetical protein